MTRGFFEIGIYHTKTEYNVGTLWRSAYQLGASGIFTIGRRYKAQSSDTLKAWKHIPLRHFEDFEDFNEHRPQNAILVGVEFGGHRLSNYVHPERCIYLLGAEDAGLPQSVMDKCEQLVSIESLTQPSFNVAVAGSIVMYHRYMNTRWV